MAANMNRGIDPAGKPLPGGQTSFLLATGLEPGAADLEQGRPTCWKRCSAASLTSSSRSWSACFLS
jgi:hypothetical protein